MEQIKEEWLTLEDVAKELNLQYQTVKQWALSGKLPSIKLGHRTIRVSRTQLNEFMKNNER